MAAKGRSMARIYQTRDWSDQLSPSLQEFELLALETYAHLPEGRIDVKMRSPLREHPLLLVPVNERTELVQQAYRGLGLSDAPPLWILRGQLGQKNRQVFEALLTAYRGDLARVLAHVQVERYTISRRYRTGAVTIGPQMAVDACERQVTADTSLNALPASLSSLTMFEPYGELVDASGGLIEYSDLLKRPLDAWKYLLLAIETGEVSLTFSTLPINAVMMASSNELHLNAFKEHPDYHSFRGRIQLVRVPYLRDYRQEQRIYETQIGAHARVHVAPHAMYVAALWAVNVDVRFWFAPPSVTPETNVLLPPAATAPALACSMLSLPLLLVRFGWTVSCCVAWLKTSKAYSIVWPAVPEPSRTPAGLVARSVPSRISRTRMRVFSVCPGGGDAVWKLSPPSLDSETPNVPTRSPLLGRRTSAGKDRLSVPFGERPLPVAR
jgi:hypothetical protein